MLRNFWLSRPRSWLFIALAALAGQVALWAGYRTPPYRVLSTDPIVVMAGSTAHLSSTVWRDSSRACNAVFSRYLYDANGYRRDMEGQQALSADAIADLAARTPGRMQLSIPVPADMPPGAAVMVTNIAYTCNPTQILWPIQVVSVIPFQVVRKGPP